MTNTNKDMNIVILDGNDFPDPQDMAMLQALYSRSPASVGSHLDRVRATGSESFLSQYYVGYGHASIGDCGFTTIFIENVSMLAAKAIQDNPLYNGQECSTRYLDFSIQPFLSANGTLVETQILENWRSLYVKSLPLFEGHARSLYDPDLLLTDDFKGDREKILDKTYKAIAFDYARNILPCGAATNVAWTTSLRKASDHCRWMMGHPLTEVRMIGYTVFSQLLQKYPSSFDIKHLGPCLPGDTADYYIGPDMGYPVSDLATLRVSDFKEWGFRVATPKTRQRAVSDHAVTFEIKGSLDFGSFRDLQRHRNGFMGVPLVSCDAPLSKWFMDALSAVSQELHIEVLNNMSLVRNLIAGETELQYLCPMGTQVPVHALWNLGQLRYTSELRTKTSVHPTLRSAILRLWNEELTMLDHFVNVWNIDQRGHYQQSNRGAQDITLKDPA